MGLKSCRFMQASMKRLCLLCQGKGGFLQYWKIFSMRTQNTDYTTQYMASTVPKRIGFLATQFDEYYQNLVFHGALEEARRYPVQLIFYEGSNTDTLNKAGVLDDTAFSLAAKTQLDGLIVMTNTMGSSFSRKRIAGYLASFQNIPTCFHWITVSRYLLPYC